MKKNNKLEARRKKVPAYIKIAVDKSFAIAEQIDIILKKKGLNQKQLADLLGKSESEISKWMSGIHNFTQTTIAKIEDVLGEPITVCLKDIKSEYNIMIFGSNQTVIVISKYEKGKGLAKKKDKIPVLTESQENLNLLTQAGSSVEELYHQECFHQLN